MVKRSIARRLQLVLEKKGRVYARKANVLGNKLRVACVNYAGPEIIKTIEEKDK